MVTLEGNNTFGKPADEVYYIEKNPKADRIFFSYSVCSDASTVAKSASLRRLLDITDWLNTDPLLYVSQLENGSEVKIGNMPQNSSRNLRRHF
jgi:hypothetical protein